MTGFEPRISEIESDRSTNWATTTAHCTIFLLAEPSQDVFLPLPYISKARGTCFHYSEIKFRPTIFILMLYEICFYRFQKLRPQFRPRDDWLKRRQRRDRWRPTWLFSASSLAPISDQNNKTFVIAESALNITQPTYPD